MEAKALVREFIWKGTKLPDPNPNLNVDQVRDILTTSHPELANAAIDGPHDKDGRQTWTFVQSVGTKG